MDPDSIHILAKQLWQTLAQAKGRYGVPEGTGVLPDSYTLICEAEDKAKHLLEELERLEVSALGEAN